MIVCIISPRTLFKKSYCNSIIIIRCFTSQKNLYIFKLPIKNSVQKVFDTNSDIWFRIRLRTIDSTDKPQTLIPNYRFAHKRVTLELVANSQLFIANSRIVPRRRCCDFFETNRNRINKTVENAKILRIRVEINVPEADRTNV